MSYGRMAPSVDRETDSQVTSDCPNDTELHVSLAYLDDAVVLERIKEYAESFSPGVLKEVESPDFMGASVPETIVEELLKVIKTAAS